MAKTKIVNSSPLVVFLLYIAAAFAVICGWRFLFPPQTIGIDILDCFRFPWRFYGGLLTFIELFPALACSGLVLPFGLKEHSEGGYAGNFFVGKKSFSPGFLTYVFWPMITASFSGILYSVLFFLVLPAATDRHYAMLDKSQLFTQAKLKAEEKARARDWAEVSQFIEICEGIWPENEAVADMKTRLIDALSSYRDSLPGETETVLPPFEQGEEDPVDAASALKLADAAFAGERYYDAHWLASLTERLSKEGQAEHTAAVTLASRAWERIAALEPTAQEKEKYSLFTMKREAYMAMNDKNWTNAFYMFTELSALTPNDPDVAKYLALCKTAVAESAFFIDELDLALGAARNGAVFSLPGPGGGRLVLTFDSLAFLRDEAYGWGTEVLVSHDGGASRFRAASDYAKLIPVSAPLLNGAETPERETSGADVQETTGHTALLLDALDRADKTKGSHPRWFVEEGVSDPLAGVNLIILPISFENLLLLSQAGQGMENLKLKELFTAEKMFGQYGYVKEAFRAEIFRRLGAVLFFLPLSIFVLVLGWRYRAGKKPRYVYVPMLVILPAVFYGAELFLGNVVEHVSVWLSLSVGFSTALACLGAGAGALFILALVLLAAQHG